VRPTTTHRIALDVLIQIFIRIQIRTIAGKIKDLDRVLMPLQPLLHPDRPVDWILIQNQINSPLHLANQTLKKKDKNLF
jgi:hypothetical protein